MWEPAPLSVILTKEEPVLSSTKRISSPRRVSPSNPLPSGSFPPLGVALMQNVDSLPFPGCPDMYVRYVLWPYARHDMTGQQRLLV
jgi:hypothetical protein